MVGLFSRINIEAESIANKAEEHVSSTEGLMATTEEHNANVDVIYNHLQDIKNSSDKLQEIIQK